MKFKKTIALLILSIFILGGCTPSSPPVEQLNVYKGSVHAWGNDVYFAYNGRTLIARNQLSGYQSQSKQSGIDIIVIQLEDGSYVIPNK